MNIETIIFDLGGVLIDWNPRYLYRTVFESAETMEHFLEHICSPEWNEQQDAGRTLQEATEWLVDKHPEWENEIRAYYGRWTEMLSGPIPETVEILARIKQNKSHRLYALTNWSHETFPYALDNFHFLHWFEGVLVSGEEKLIKPDPKIYELILHKFEIDRSTALFIDDNIKNVKGAEAVGLRAVHFQSPAGLEEQLTAWGVL